MQRAELQPPQKKRRLNEPLNEICVVGKQTKNKAAGTQHLPITISSSTPVQNQQNQAGNLFAPSYGQAAHQQPALPSPGESSSAIASGGVPLPQDDDDAVEVAPHRPQDRNAEGYKEQIRQWYGYVQRQIVAKAYYVVKGQLGEGGQGRVLLLENTISAGELVVAKIFAKENDAREEIRMLKEEIGQHTNLVTMIRDWLPGAPIPGVSVLFLQYCNEGSLCDYRDSLCDKETPIPESTIWHVAISLGRALAFLHSGWPTPEYGTHARLQWALVHRDIKPENVLLSHDATQPDNLLVKLGDFGMAQKLRRDITGWSNVHTNAGTHDWQAPEQVAYPHFAGPEQDIWALGAIIHYMALGEPPIDISRANNSYEYKSQTWKASIPRRITKISSRPDLRKNLGKQKNYMGDGHLQWSKKYSIKINRWMMRLLKITPSERATAVEVATEMPGDCRYQG